MARWDFWRTARAIVAVLALMTALYYVIVAFDNITNPQSNWPFVQGVLSGDGTPPDDGFEWREIHAQWFQVVAYIGIIVCESIAGILLAAGGFLGLRGSGDHNRWLAAQRWTLVGSAVGLLVFFVGFISVGGNWFIMYLNSEWNGLDPAFQNSVMTTLTLIAVLAVATGGRHTAAPATGTAAAAPAEDPPAPHGTASRSAHHVRQDGTGAPTSAAEPTRQTST